MFLGLSRNGPQELFAKNALFGSLEIFSLDMSQISFHFAGTYAEIKISSFGTTKWPTSLGFSIFFNFFFGFPFFLCFFLSFYWACFQFKNFWESIIDTGYFYYGVVKCSRRKFCCEFFTQISEHFRVYLGLHWADHSDVVIIGKQFSSCRTWILMMPILVKGDDVRSGSRHRSQFVKFIQKLCWLSFTHLSRKDSFKAAGLSPICSRLSKL